MTDLVERLNLLAYAAPRIGLKAGEAELVKEAAATISTLQAEVERQETSRAARDVLAERRRQMEAEGWTPEHDDEHRRGEMASAAACYALCSRTPPGSWFHGLIARIWPWSPEWWKPKGRRSDLIKAGALILAEIERLDRLAIRALTKEDGR